jgi:hypothetical protein
MSLLQYRNSGRKNWLAGTWVLALVTALGCSSGEKEKKDPLFETLPASVTKVQFTNQVTDDADFNIFNYRNFYNGGGVALGDVNNDGLPDLFLIANMGENKLYLNKGNFQFEDITAKSGVTGKRAWSTGATFADVNGDGLLDIYVCNAGTRDNDDRANELFINNGNLTFTEKSKEYNLDDQGFSTHAAFFDYDRDGDLDMYLLNNSFIPVGRLGYENLRTRRDVLGGDKFFRNDGGKFTDVSEAAGVYGSLIGFGLGITIGDVNNDNWPDIYISNDFYERDYLYINNQNGTFREDIREQMGHTSLSSMGADIADINNDGNLDIFVTDMLPGNDARQKTTSTFENYDLFQLKLSRDFHKQYMQNMLQLNNGDNTFSEVARLAGVHATDWSWGALIFDMDNDGLKDIFVANGIYKDLTNQDFVQFLADENNMEQMARGKKFDFKEFLDLISSTPIPNYAFRNEGNLQFRNQAADWGLGEPSFSNGAAYGDLDNDGDLDLVVNNVNQPVSILRNRTTEKLKSHFLRVKLNGTGGNRHAIGTKVYLHQGNQTQYLQQMPNRGFQSSVDHVLVFGLGQKAAIDSLTVIWPDDKMQVLKNVKPDGLLTLQYGQADRTFVPGKEKIGTPFFDATEAAKLAYRHQENNFVDYNRDALLKQMYSTSGPALAVADVNGDGLDDLYLGGASGKRRGIFLQDRKGAFAATPASVFMADSLSEDVAAVFFDADGDKDQDLYVVSGGNEFLSGDPPLADHLYLNDGKGNFAKADGLPNLYESGSCVAAADFDKDGDMDLFIGGRLVPGQYGHNPPSYLYINDGTGNFKNYTRRYMQDSNLGMVTDAAWADLDKDGYPELMVVGDWMPVTVFKNQRGKLVRGGDAEIAGSSGWWNRIKPADLDGDGDMDFIVGNLGRNTRLPASPEQPARLHINDFDKNGTVEQIITCYSEDGKPYPMVLKHDLQKQVPLVKKKFLKYGDYAGKGLDQIFTEEERKGAVVKEVANPSTSFLLNQGNGKFTLKALPVEVQFSPIYGIETVDYNSDGRPDILLAGNFFDVLPELGQYDANYGLVLEGTGGGEFRVLKPKESGFFVTGQVRDMRKVKGADGKERIVLVRNNGNAAVFGYRTPKGPSAVQVAYTPPVK